MWFNWIILEWRKIGMECSRRTSCMLSNVPCHCTSCCTSLLLLLLEKLILLTLIQKASKPDCTCLTVGVAFHLIFLWLSAITYIVLDYCCTQHMLLPYTANAYIYNECIRRLHNVWETACIHSFKVQTKNLALYKNGFVFNGLP